MLSATGCGQSRNKAATVSKMAPCLVLSASSRDIGPATVLRLRKSKQGFLSGVLESVMKTGGIHGCLAVCYPTACVVRPALVRGWGEIPSRSWQRI